VSLTCLTRHPNTTDSKYDYKAPHLLLTLPFVQGTWTINYGKGHTLQGYGDEWKEQVAWELLQGRAVSVADWSKGTAEDAAASVNRPMVDPSLVHSEPAEDPPYGEAFRYVNLADYLALVPATVLQGTWLPDPEGYEGYLATNQVNTCPDCGEPVFQWNGARHFYAKGKARLDNDAGFACPTVKG
jgi:hypothetical protein